MTTQINELEINGKTYVPKDSIKENLSPNYLGDVKIVVLQRERGRGRVLIIK